MIPVYYTKTPKAKKGVDITVQAHNHPRYAINAVENRIALSTVM